MNNNLHLIMNNTDINNSNKIIFFLKNCFFEACLKLFAEVEALISL